MRIDDLAADLRRAMHEGVVERNDFVIVAVYGERLRRGCDVVSDVDAIVAGVLDRYDAMLIGLSPDTPTPTGAELSEDAQASLVDLAGLPTALSMRDVEVAQELLVELDDIVSVAVAMVRAKRLRPDELDALAGLIITTMGELVGRMVELNDFMYALVRLTERALREARRGRTIARALEAFDHRHAEGNQ